MRGILAIDGNLLTNVSYSNKRGQWYTISINFRLASYAGKPAMLRESVSKYMARDSRLDNYVVISDAVNV